MILTTHAIVGASVGRLVLNPYEAFVFGFISHFLIDAIPHWSYSLKSIIRDEKDPLKKDMVINRRFVRDLAVIGLDFCAGIILSIFIFQGATGFINLSLPILAGALAGVLPDALQFVYFKIRREPFIALQKLHLWFHLKHRDDIPGLPYGVPSQIFVIIAAIFISKLLL